VAETPIVPSDRGERQANGVVERARVFIAEVRNELKRVTWPSGQEVYATTVVVIVVSVVLGLYLWGLDRLLDQVEGWIFRRF
jgi:preprotein translocase subunit SecE